jgi:hypothetical protein
MSIRLGRVVVMLGVVAVAISFGGQERYIPHPTAATRELAGEYYLGDGLGANLALTLEPSGRFGFAWHGCLGLYDHNEGTYGLSRYRLVFNLEMPNDPNDFHFTTDLVPVHWGARTYLVSEAEMAKFCHAVSEGREPRVRPHGWFYLRRGDEMKSVRGLPDIPTKYRKLLAASPVVGWVTSVKDRTVVIIDSGRRDGLNVGDRFRVGDARVFGKVTALTDRNATLTPDDPNMQTASTGVWIPMPRVGGMVLRPGPLGP